MSHRRAPSRPHRPYGHLHRLVAALVAVALAAVVLGSEAGAQSIDDLRARAARIAAELQRMEDKASVLNEQYLETQEQVRATQRRIEENRAAVATAERQLEAARSNARGFAVSAYIGAGRNTATIGAQDPNEAVNSQVLLETLQGDQLQVADNLRAARMDLQDRNAELEQSSATLRSQQERQQSLKSQLDQGVQEQRDLLSGTNAQLQSAIRAEQERQAAEAERQAREAAARAAAQAQAQAQAQAAAAATARSAAPQRAASSGGAAPARTAQAAPVPARPKAAAPAPPPAPVSAPNGGAGAAIAAAQSVLGTPYRYGGNSPGGFDCSGLTSWAWARAGVGIPRTSGGQYAGTQRVPLDQIQPGDLVFFGSPIHHVGLYIGGGMMIHSPHTGDVVKVAPIFRGFGSPVGAGRVR